MKREGDDVVIKTLKTLANKVRNGGRWQLEVGGHGARALNRLRSLFFGSWVDFGKGKVGLRTAHVKGYL